MTVYFHDLPEYNSSKIQDGARQTTTAPKEAKFSLTHLAQDIFTILQP